MGSRRILFVKEQKVSDPGTPAEFGAASARGEMRVRIDRRTRHAMVSYGRYSSKRVPLMRSAGCVSVRLK